VFVVCNVIYFLMQPLTVIIPFTSSLRIQTTAARRSYAESPWRTAFKTLLLSGWAVAVLTAYRFLLFFTCFYAT